MDRISAATATTSTADGRTLAFCEWGDREGTPVFSLHGTPGSRLGRHPDEDVYRRAGVRVVTYDRAGYGGSTRHHGRQVADAAGDVAAVADVLGLTRFAVTGGSGGAPHALACAALMPDRVTRCASVVGPAPFGPGGLSSEEWLDGMVEGNVKEFGWALEGEDTLRPELEREADELIASLDSDSAQPLGEDYTLSPEDLAVIGAGEIRAMLTASVKEGIGRSVDGIVDDDLAFTRPWGFEVSEITVPVAVWYGPHDTLVPAGHGEWLARTIPGAEVVVLDGGHFAIYDRMSELMAWLADGPDAG
jgi:pimeloyl-ACP methyl ester carboxylesterase